MGIDTREVLQAAGTKWNFLPFRPGLVGGHCIGVDPYYLTHKAAGDRLPPARSSSPAAASTTAWAATSPRSGQGHAPARQIDVAGPGCWCMGLAFKENCPDLRNTQGGRHRHELRDYGVRSATSTTPGSSKRGRAARIRHRPDRAARQGRLRRDDPRGGAQAVRGDGHGSDPLVRQGRAGSL